MPAPTEARASRWWRLIFVVPLVLVGASIIAFSTLPKMDFGGYAIPFFVLSAWIWNARSRISLGIAIALSTSAVLVVAVFFAVLLAMLGGK